MSEDEILEEAEVEVEEPVGVLGSELISVIVRGVNVDEGEVGLDDKVSEVGSNDEKEADSDDDMSVLCIFD